jgi:hypothetical protein
MNLTIRPLKKLFAKTDLVMIKRLIKQVAMLQFQALTTIPKSRNLN